MQAKIIITKENLFVKRKKKKDSVIFMHFYQKREKTGNSRKNREEGGFFLDKKGKMGDNILVPLCAIQDAHRCDAPDRGVFPARNLRYLFLKGGETVIQYKSRLFRPGHVHLLALCIFLGAFSILCAGLNFMLRLHLFLYPLCVLLLGGAIGGALRVVREMEWCEFYPAYMVVKNPLGEVNRLPYENLEAVSQYTEHNHTWVVLWDGRPLVHKWHGKRGLNHASVAVRVLVTNAAVAILSRIPVKDKKRMDRRLMMQALTGEEATFLWQDKIYELVYHANGKLAWYKEDDDKITLLGYYRDMSDFKSVAIVANTPVRALCVPLGEAFPLDGDTLRDRTVHGWIQSEKTRFLASDSYRELAELTRDGGATVVVETHFLRPSPTIAYTAGLGVRVVSGDGEVILASGDAFSWECETAWGDDTGHLELTKWEENPSFIDSVESAKNTLHTRIWLREVTEARDTSPEGSVE